jgi:hypothetical protein
MWPLFAAAAPSFQSSKTPFHGLFYLLRRVSADCVVSPPQPLAEQAVAREAKMNEAVSKARWTGAASLAALLLVAACPAAADTPAVAYDMPAQSLGEALSALSRRAGVAVIAPTPLVEELRAPALKGTYPPDEAIHRLLAGSGLVAERVGESYVVKRPGHSEAELPETLRTDIVVTGTRIRGAPVASTQIRLSAEAIRNSGQATVADAMRSLPQNFGGGQNPGVGNNVPEANGLDIGGGSSVDLRGLGPDATLTLLNGHRLPYSSSGHLTKLAHGGGAKTKKSGGNGVSFSATRNR